MIEESYPQAVDHFRSAQQCKSKMAARWSAAFGEQFMGAYVQVDHDGSGTITASVRWPDGLREELTQDFTHCVEDLWSALDSLVIETVQLFSSWRTPRDPEAKRFWPIANSQENFERLLEQACINGVLRTHFQIIRDCQPFLLDSSIEQVQQMQAGLRQLLAWSEALDAGEQVTVWATPTEPTIWTRPSRETVECSLNQPFDVGIEPGVVARFQVPNYEPNMRVEAQPGTMLDLGFAAGFTPSGIDDTFEKRLKDVITAVSLFHAHFAAVTGHVRGTRALPITPAERGDLWIDASRSSRSWRASELSELAKSGARVAVVIDPDPNELILLVPTADGVFERRIPNATRLRPSETIGIAAEHAVREAAATWGLPDFIMRPKVERKGSGVREVGDGLLIVGEVGAIVQVKGRSIEPSSADKESRWIDKNVVKAVKQVNGTYRRLQLGPVDLENGRGRRLQIDGRALRWVGVVIVDHPEVPQSHPVATTAGSLPIVVLTRRDWEFLFEQLKSTSAVIRYLLRVEVPSEFIGEEPHRYFDLASRDAAASPNEPNPMFEGLGTTFHHPLLPTEPAGAQHPTEFGLVRLICEDIASLEGEDLTPNREVDVLAAIDALPVSARADLGNLLLQELSRTAEAGSTRWRFRTFLPSSPGGYQVSFAVCSAYNEMVSAGFRAWATLRHSERREREDISAARSIAVLLTPRSDGRRPWDTTLFVVEGELDLSDGELNSYVGLWGRRGEAGNVEA